MRLALHEQRDEWENEAMARRGELRFAVRYTPGCRESGRQAIVTKLQKDLGKAVGGP